VVVRLMRFSRRELRAVRFSEWVPRLTAWPVRWAALSGVVVVVLAALLLSPWFRVGEVVWTGPLHVSDADCAALEALVLGQPLFLLPESALRAALPQSEHLRLRVHRRPPRTLGFGVEARRGVARFGDGAVLGADGRLLDSVPPLAGLPRLVGFPCSADGRGLEPEGRAVLRAVLDVLRDPALAPAVVTWDAATDRLELELAHGGERVLCDAGRAASQLLKLRILARSLGSEPLPASMDLRFADQVVVRNLPGGGHGARRPR
jgi:cell division septal protein FtsQ